MKAKREFAIQIASENEGSKIHEAALHLAASQIYEVICDFDLQKLKDLLKGRSGELCQCGELVDQSWPRRR